MLNTRTVEEFHKWKSEGNYPNMPKRFGRRMGLEPKEVKKMVNEVIEKHKGATREDNKDVKNKNI